MAGRIVAQGLTEKLGQQVVVETLPALAALSACYVSRKRHLMATSS